jgi:rod shape-determining protein MreC
MKAKNQTSLASKHWLLILIGVCILLIALSVAADRGNKANPLNTVAAYTVVPMQRGLNKIGTWLSDFTKNFATLEEVRAENEALRQKNDNLIIENNQLQQKSVELERFYDLYSMDQQTADYEKVGARVIASDTNNWFSEFIIDKGSKDGMRVDMNVMAGRGLVGIITQTGPNWSTVRTIINNDSNISGMVLTTFDSCIVSGDITLIRSGVIQFGQLENNENQVPIGEQIVTSHISNKYLQGLLIGTVKEVEVDANNLTRSGRLIPAVDFRSIQEVLVITTTKQDLIDKKDNKDSENNLDDTGLIEDTEAELDENTQTE